MSRRTTLKQTIMSFRFAACIAILFVAFLLVAITMLSRSRAVVEDSSIDYDDLWSYESGSIVDFNDLNLDNETDIHKRTNGMIINTKSLCFYSKNIYFSIYLDGELIYDFHPKAPKFLGKSYGIYPHTISMPVIQKDGYLRIHIEKIYPNDSGYIQGIKLDAGSHYLINELQKRVYEFIICLIVFVFGLVLFVIGLFGRYYGDRRYEIMSLGALSVVSALWIASETQVFSILISSPIAAHFADYIALDLISFPAIVFCAYITENKNTRLTFVVGLMTIFKVFFSLISTMVDYKDYHQLLYLSHIVLFITVGFILFLIIRCFVLKKIRKLMTIIFSFVLLISVISGTMDIVQYFRESDAFDTFTIFEYSLFLFILLSGIYEFIIISEMSRKGRYAEIMENLAYKDGLTGLLNRLAFNKKMEQITDGSDRFTFIMLDMNYLKKVNDQLGHNTGDRYITTAAKYISASFMDGDECYRMGGDEFFIITSKEAHSDELRSNIDSLYKKIELFNHENQYSIPLSIAYGVSEFNPSESDIDSTIRTADQQMYKMKADMKKALAI